VTTSFAIAIITVFAVCMSAATGYFYSKHKSALKRLVELENRSSNQLDALLTSNQFSARAANLLRLRQKAARVRRAAAKQSSTTGDG